MLTLKKIEKNFLKTQRTQSEMAKNLWQKERSGLMRDLIREYVDEGYAYKEAKKLAKKEADNIMEDKVSFVHELWEDTFDDC